MERPGPDDYQAAAVTGRGEMTKRRDGMVAVPVPEGCRDIQHELPVDMSSKSR